MELLFGRFQHLVEDIFGQLDGETLFRCNHINKTWNRNIEEYRLRLAKKIQERLKNTSIAADFDKKEEGQYSPIILFEKLPISTWYYSARLCTIE